MQQELDLWHQVGLCAVVGMRSGNWHHHLHLAVRTRHDCEQIYLPLLQACELAPGDTREVTLRSDTRRSPACAPAGARGNRVRARCGGFSNSSFPRRREPNVEKRVTTKK